MSKIVFFDIDGTLWDERMNIPDSTIEAIAALKANGHGAFLCTGRARASVNSDKLLNMGFDGIIAACGNYIEMDDKVIYEKDLRMQRENSLFTKERLNNNGSETATVNTLSEEFF